METVNGVMTGILIVLFIGIWIWAWSKRNKAAFDHMANLPLEESDSELSEQKGETHE